jgi:hypothetical protein
MTPDKRIALSRSYSAGNDPQKLVEVALKGERVGNGGRLGRPRLDCDAGCDLVPDLHCPE